MLFSHFEKLPSLIPPLAATIKRMLKSNPNKTTRNEIGVVEKKTDLNSKKNWYP